MARYRRRGRRYRGSKDSAMSAGLTQLVSLALILYVFDQILTAIMPTINVSTYFATAVSFLQNLLPIFGILGAYWVIKRTLVRMKMS